MHRDHALFRSGAFVPVNEHTLPIQAPMFYPEGDGGAGGGTGGDGGAGGAGGGQGGGQKDAAYWEAEAKKAFKDRDAAKAEMRKLKDSGQVLSDEQLTRYKELEQQAAQAEEARAKAAGEWDKLRTQLVEKHTNELTQERTKVEQLSSRFKHTVVRAEFGRATEMFGGHAEAKTIFDVDMAIDVLGKYVHVEDVENDPLGYRVVVRLPNGDTVLGSDGKPAPFADAIGELISALPNKDRILRGSGKTGSGNSGGSSHSGDRGPINVGQPIDRNSLTDPAVRRQVKDQLAKAGGLQIGRAWDNRK